MRYWVDGPGMYSSKQSTGGLTVFVVELSHPLDTIVRNYVIRFCGQPVFRRVPSEPPSRSCTGVAPKITIFHFVLFVEKLFVIYSKRDLTFRQSFFFTKIVSTVSTIKEFSHPFWFP